MENSTQRILSTREIFEEHQRRMLALDMSGQADLYAEDGVMYAPFAAWSPNCRVQGREAIRKILVRAGERAKSAGVRPTGYDYRIVHEMVDPEIIMVEQMVNLELAATGEKYQLPYVQVYQVRNGEIIEFRDYYTDETAQSKLKEDGA